MQKQQKRVRRLMMQGIKLTDEEEFITSLIYWSPLAAIDRQVVVLITVTFATSVDDCLILPLLGF